VSTEAGSPAGCLVVCPTPIGNLGDITQRSVEALRSADVVASEDTRRTRILLEHLGIDARPIALHDKNERSAAAGLIRKVRDGGTVVLVSDAGTPVVSDPGFLLVRACIEEGLRVEVLPGATAVTTALVLSGLPADSFRFIGFLPRRPGDLKRVFDESRETLVAFDSPKRITATITQLAEAEPERQVVVCRELTKIHEEAIRGTAAEVAAELSGRDVKGEITVVIGPQAEREFDSAAALKAVRELVAEGARPRTAARVIAGLTGLRANDLYSARDDSD